MKVVVTGGTGFVGTALIDRLLREERFEVRGAVRGASRALPAGVESVMVGELTPDTVWGPTVSGADVVVHLAARVHMMRDRAADPTAEFQRVNVLATRNLARQAAQAGVKRFVYLSSVKGVGDGASNDGAFDSRDAYGLSKRAAESALRDATASTGMEVVIIRPPLVYGPGVKANFQMLMRAVSRGVPLPLGAVHNRRSFIALDNLVDFIVTCIEHPAAANEIFTVSDGEDLSTPDLIRRIARAMGRPARLIPIPAPLLMAAARLLGKGEVADRLLGSLQVDCSRAREVLGWKPPISVDEGLRRAVAKR